MAEATSAHPRAAPTSPATLGLGHEREQAGREPPYGPVLDLGCGSGIWATRLAKRGPQVTGVDHVPKALRRARERAAKERLNVRLLEDDVTAPERSDIASGFRLLLDLAVSTTS